MKLKTNLLTLASVALLSGTAFAGVSATEMGLTSTGASSAPSAGGLSGFGRNITDDSLPMLSAGTQELGISGSLNLDNVTTYSLDLSYGYFVRDNWEIGVTGEMIGNNSNRDFNVGFFTEYNFATGSKWVPFVGGAVVWNDVGLGNIDDDGLAFRGTLGLKYFLRSHMAIAISTGFDWHPDNATDVDLAPNFDIGMRFYF